MRPAACNGPNAPVAPVAPALRNKKLARHGRFRYWLPADPLTTRVSKQTQWGLRFVAADPQLLACRDGATPAPKGVMLLRYRLE